MNKIKKIIKYLKENKIPHRIYRKSKDKCEIHYVCKIEEDKKVMEKITPIKE